MIPTQRRDMIKAIDKMKTASTALEEAAILLYPYYHIFSSAVEYIARKSIGALRQRMEETLREAV